MVGKQKGEPEGSPFKSRDDWTRTSDHTSPRRVLYQLSYIPMEGCKCRRFSPTEKRA